MDFVRTSTLEFMTAWAIVGMTNDETLNKISNAN